VSECCNLRCCGSSSYTRRRSQNEIAPRNSSAGDLGLEVESDPYHLLAAPPGASTPVTEPSSRSGEGAGALPAKDANSVKAMPKVHEVEKANESFTKVKAHVPEAKIADAIAVPKEAAVSLELQATPGADFNQNLV